MLINELSFTKKQELARDLRKLIEPDKSQSKCIIKEATIRKFLSSRNLTYYGIFDIISVLRSNYTEKNISRLVSKVQKSIVWDTCLCNLSQQEITDLLFNSDYENIITRSVYDELLKLTLQKSNETGSSDNAFRLITNILEDTESNFCSIINLPPQISENKYVDNQLLEYCLQNNYTLYTHDYVLGLRAKSRNIAVKAFYNFDEIDVEQYTSNPEGKNILLDSSLLDTVTISDIIATAKSIKGNKFILTRSFIEYLEFPVLKKLNRELIKFFIFDADNKYTMYISDDEPTNYMELTKKYNAVVFTPDISQCIAYKTYFIPYKLVYPRDENAFKQVLLTALQASPYNNYKNIDDGDFDIESTEELTVEDISDSESAQPKAENDEDLEDGDLPANVQLFVVPHYSPQNRQLNLKKLMPNEKMWVLDERNTEISADSNSKINLYIGHTVVHIKNNLNDTFSLNVFKIVNRKTVKCGTKLVSLIFDKNNIETCVPGQYQHFAKIAIMMT